MAAIQIPGEVPGWRDLVGRYVNTARFGRVKFGKFGMEVYVAAAACLVPWPKGLLVVGAGCEGLPEVGHPLTIELLRKAKARLVTAGANPAGSFVSNGFYRPPGTTWGIGRYGDPNGVIDSTDVWGHWRLAIDIGRQASADLFRVEKVVLMEALGAVGLSRPFMSEGEGWHYRPNAAQRERWVTKCVTSKT